MAKATKIFSENNVQTGITLQLSLEEAAVLRSLLGQCTCSFTYGLFHALTNEGAKDMYDVKNLGEQSSPNMSICLSRKSLE